ncbi:MAG: hypothetical protein J7J82_04980 [Staphylothermus sp.]|nr:hypothetical protein [Staphylothermus sp.]
MNIIDKMLLFMVLVYTIMLIIHSNDLINVIVIVVIAILLILFRALIGRINYVYRKSI